MLRNALLLGLALAIAIGGYRWARACPLRREDTFDRVRRIYGLDDMKPADPLPPANVSMRPQRGEEQPFWKSGS